MTGYMALLIGVIGLVLFLLGLDQLWQVGIVGVTRVGIAIWLWIMAAYLIILAYYLALPKRRRR